MEQDPHPVNEALSFLLPRVATEEPLHKIVAAADSALRSGARVIPHGAVELLDLVGVSELEAAHHVAAGLREQLLCE